MAIQYPRYRMRDGHTRLAEGYFNPIWQDLDGRLHRIEALRVEWEGAVAELAQFGIERLDAVVAPLITQAQGQIAEAVALGASLVTLVEELDWTAHLAAELGAHSATVQGWLDGAAADLAAHSATVQGWLDGAVADLAAAIAQPSALTIAYDAEGRVTAVSETLPAGARTTTYSYDAEGRITQAVSLAAGVERTETYQYTDGALTVMTATEESA